jgi:hypothetical protein
MPCCSCTALGQGPRQQGLVDQELAAALWVLLSLFEGKASPVRTVLLGMGCRGQVLPLASTCMCRGVIGASFGTTAVESRAVSVDQRAKLPLGENFLCMKKKF